MVGLLLSVVVVLLVVAVILWGVAQLPIDATIAKVVRVVVIVLVCLWLISLLAGGSSFAWCPRLR